MPKKKASIIVDLSSSSEKRRLMRALGVEEPKKGFTVVPTVACPMCGIQRGLRRTGIRRVLEEKKTGKRKGDYAADRMYRDGFVAFDYDIEELPFLTFRAAMGRKGFVTVAVRHLSDIKNMPERDKEILYPLLEQIKRQCERILDAVNRTLE